jgi:hypothetical protein
MQRAAQPTNGEYYTLYIAGEHYGFADFDYPGTGTLTYLTLGKNCYVEMPIRATSCFAAIAIPLLLIVGATVFSYRRRLARLANRD